MDLKLQKNECPPGRYWIFRQGRGWEVKVLSNGTIFIRLKQKVYAKYSSLLNYYFNITEIIFTRTIGKRSLLYV
jgi:hypothetical protein